MLERIVLYAGVWSLEGARDRQESEVDVQRRWQRVRSGHELALSFCVVLICVNANSGDARRWCVSLFALMPLYALTRQGLPRYRCPRGPCKVQYCLSSALGRCSFCWLIGLSVTDRLLFRTLLFRAKDGGTTSFLP